MAYRPESAAEAFRHIQRGTKSPRTAIGDFIDDWRRCATPQEKAALVRDPIPDARTPEEARWAAYLSGAVEHLARQDGVPVPDWCLDGKYVLEEPWFLNPYWKLRAWQLVTTPPAFKRRRIFGGDTMLSRV